MAAKGNQAMPNGSRKEENAFWRVLRLPVVNSACSSLQKTYNAAKESHPLVASVCDAYERGIQAASSLAAWSMKPVVRKLEPQLAVANVLACQGLDHLEQRIPALHKPVEEVTSELKGSIGTHIQSARHSIADALDWILGLAEESCEQAQNTVRDVVEDARSSRVSYMAEAGVEVAIGKVEKLVGALRPKPECNSAREDSEIRVSREGSPSGIFGRVSALALNVSQLAYRQTTRTIQHTRAKGEEWAMWIPGLGGLAGQSSTKTQRIFSSAQETASDWLSTGQRKAPKQEEEGKNDDDRRSTTEGSAKARSLVGSLTQSLQAAYLSAVSALKGDPVPPCSAAGQRLHLSPRRAGSEASTKAGTLWGVLQTIASGFLGTIFHYVPVPRLLAKEEGTAAGITDGAETYQQQESRQPLATRAQERGPHDQLRGDWQSNRGHLPLPFLNLDEPHPVQQAPFQHRSPALEANSTSARKSAFSPYKEAAGSRRLSEGLYRSNSESVYGKAHYPGLYRP
uniref:perilipin-1 n=1 Tax=Euleptes europaea TaxID=460621 RepID=UPI002541C186|nr:perilipin-1 [Euleptes europaea]